MKARTSPHRRPRTSADDATWYKDAIIYELRIRSFFDSNGDGIGDIIGLESKLDYLADLGVTALWLLPFYPSPQRDDGYDISDYTNVHADLGTLDDFRRVLASAHSRGMRVITELVLNHTSDQHPWFQRARRAPRGTPERNFYVWSEDDSRYRDARIIFNDFEASNWTRDPIAHDFFWHRFYSHQPDLNFENPAVREALLGVVDFWLGLGVDGLRLDAVPYLYEEDGTSCENLPKTHEFLRALRAHVDAKFPNRMLLAEANQWPDDAAAYFGDDDECHMNFHFPIMPRMFMAIHMEDSLPIVDILAQTPAPPPSCQWALFLRNHDELTLETVTDDERDYMYRAYASDSASRINLGIRRRLAPLVENDRRKLELLNGLLLSLSGTPVVYYGDEIGMGDNVFLGDRDGVRTPMQWSMDRNAGFSKANPQRLVLPVNVDSMYHYESLNVEAQQGSSSSLLWWMKRIISVRRDSRVFGRGTLEVLSPSNSRVLAFLRRLDEETVLVVANLARSVQFVELDLSSFKGLRPVEMFGGSAFPVVGDAPYTLTLHGHTFYWFSLERDLATDPPSVHPLEEVPTVSSGSAASLLTSDRAVVEERLLSYLRQQRWFHDQGKDVRSGELAHVVPCTVGDDTLLWTIIRVRYSDGSVEEYSMLLMAIVASLLREGRFSGVVPLVMVSPPDSTDSVRALIDVLDDAVIARGLLDSISQSQSYAGDGVKVMTTSTGPVDASVLKSVPRVVPGLHLNVPIQLDDRYLLKLYRRLEPGTRLDIELSRAVAPLRPSNGPDVVGTIELMGVRVSTTLGVLKPYVTHVGTAWERALTDVARYFERILTSHPREQLPALPSRSDAAIPALVHELMGPSLDGMTTLGARTAELHRDLLALVGLDLDPEPSTRADRRADYQTARGLAGTVLRDLRDRSTQLDGLVSREASLVFERKSILLRRLDPLLSDGTSVPRMRIHGNLHLEQVLLTGKDVVVLDYDGELDRSVNERRRRQSPLRDLAGMLWSLGNATLVTLWESARIREGDRETLAPWAHVWSAWAGSAFLNGYADAARGTPLLPAQEGEMDRLLGAFTMERALRDVREDIRRGIGGAVIPLRALAQSLESPVHSQ